MTFLINKELDLYHTKWYLHHKDMQLEHLGLIPSFLDELNPDDAITQINRNYQHGGGWYDMEGFELSKDDDPPWASIIYAINDEPAESYTCLAHCKIHDEIVAFYRSAWVAVIKPNLSFRVARID